MSKLWLLLFSSLWSSGDDSQVKWIKVLLYNIYHDKGTYTQQVIATKRGRLRWLGKVEEGTQTNAVQYTHVKKLTLIFLFFFFEVIGKSVSNQEINANIQLGTSCFLGW